MTQPAIATDKSMRRYDADGHLHVQVSHISKANVCPYYGREIPEYKALGLDANRIYRLYRHPDELAKGAQSFAGKPLLMHHQPVTADEHPEDLVVGTIGTDVTFDGLYLNAPLSVWTADAITAVETEEQRELSPGYRYRADMTPGRTPQGVAFDGVMRDIRGNHVALVHEGRTGPDVYVADEQPLELSAMKFPKVMALLAAVLPTMKAEQAIALDEALAVDLKAVAADKAPDLSEDEMNAACDAFAKKEGKERDKLSDEDKAEAYRRAAADRAPAAATKTAPPHAADEATVQLAVDTAVAKALEGMVSKADADKLALDASTAARAAAAAEVHALYAARAAVESTVGVVALDSAELVYRFALDHLKVEHKDVPASALAALYQGAATARPAPAVALDAAAVEFDLSILGVSHIRKG